MVRLPPDSSYSSLSSGPPASTGSLVDMSVRYPYPLFEILTPAWRAALFAGSAFVMTLSTATLKWLYGRVNGYGVGTAPRARSGNVKE